MERVGYIDIVKFIGIFLMVLCHAGMHNAATSVIYAFHMPLFFFISGYMVNPGKKRKVSRILKNKGKTVLIPYFIFALILCFGTRKMVDWPLLIYGSRDALHAASCFTPLWFLPCFFLSTVLFQTIIRLKLRSETLFTIAVIGCSVLGFILSVYRTHLQYGFPWNFDTALVGVGIMFFGYITRKVKVVERMNYVWGGDSFDRNRIVFLKFARKLDPRQSSCGNVCFKVRESCSVHAKSITVLCRYCNIGKGDREQMGGNRIKKTSVLWGKHNNHLMCSWINTEVFPVNTQIVSF